MVDMDNYTLDRRAVVARLLRDRDGIMVVAGLGSPSYDLHATEGVETLVTSIGQAAHGPRLYAVKIKAENLPRSLPSRDAVYIKNRLRAQLGLAVS